MKNPLKSFDKAISIDNKILSYGLIKVLFITKWKTIIMAIQML